ncbi:MAG: flagellar basal-body rod protein FlgF [Pseudobdellovibrionaceae bacterium]|nr:flagellar basal-body rod protein FlgF [Bdellovibrionales bacterium]USN46488.1 MAG: flagellar basal-body rod protein FlgF [Pseudobdellovibrionaceae bacterium]
MSNKGIYTALSGAIAQSQRLDTIANNLANTSTTGFKKDDQVFYEYLTANEKGTDVIQVPKIPASIESFYHMQGGDRGYVDSAGTYTNFEQGILRPTGNPLDVALEGHGFLEVLTPNGVRMTRDGSFKVNDQGILVSKQGFPVLQSLPGVEPEQRTITANQGQITISYSGDVYAGGELAGRLAVVDFEKRDVLQKEGQGLYKVKNNFEVEPRAVEGAKVHQGFVEASNVNVVEEMTSLIQATRAFESTQQAIKAFDTMNEKLVNVVPKAN